MPGLCVPNRDLHCAVSDLCKWPGREGQRDGWPGVKCNAGTAWWSYRKGFKLNVCNELGMQQAFPKGANSVS